MSVRRFRVIHPNGFVFADDHQLEYRYPYLSEFDAVRENEVMIRLPMVENPVSTIAIDPRTGEINVLVIEIETFQDVLWQIMAVPERGVHVYKDPKLEEYDSTIPKGTRILVKNRMSIDGQYVYELYPDMSSTRRYMGYDFYHYAFLCPPLMLLPMERVLVGQVINPDGVIVRKGKEPTTALVGLLPVNARVYIKNKAFSSFPLHENVHRYELVQEKGWINVYSQGCMGNVVILGHVPDGFREEDVEMSMMEVGSPHETLPGEKNDYECCISCMQRTPNAVFVHGTSGHATCCLDCAHRIHRRKMSCPLCRTKIDKVIQLF